MNYDSSFVHHSDTWLGSLNLITPPLSVNPSPTPGPQEESDRSLSSLSFPIAPADLYASLEAWSNVHFSGLDGPGEFSPSASGFGCDLPDQAFEERPYALPSFGTQTLPQFDAGQAFVNPFAAVQPALFHLDAGAYTNPVAGILPVEQQEEVTTPAVRKKAAPKGKAGKKVVDDGPGEGDGDKLAYEEDKRRRNTAASTRFRAKKKEREAALESTNKELRDRVSGLKDEVKNLQMENKWLRDLVVNKADKEELGKKRALEEEEEESGGSKKARIEEGGELWAAILQSA